MRDVFSDCYDDYEDEQVLPEANECINEESTYCVKCPYCGPCQGYPPQSVLEGKS
jgi:hypothetical protein